MKLLTTELFSLGLELLIKQQTNKKQQQQIDFYIRIIYTHIYKEKGACGFHYTGQMRVKT